MEILEAKTDVGLIREENEDMALAISHPRNKSIKMLLVADGMGGKKNGKVASFYVSTSLNRWFLNKSVKTLNDSIKVEKLLSRYIKLLNTNLINTYGHNNLGTTLTVAIINKKETIVFNIGDSRAYIYKRKKLIQITEDDSDVWLYFKYGGVKKDYLRFFPTNNIITSCIGLEYDLCRISITKIPNNYDMIMLFTDGVTDLITDKKILNIIKKEKDENILKKIIDEAVYCDQKFKIPLSLKRKYKIKYVLPFKGRDNASGVIYKI